MEHPSLGISLSEAESHTQSEKHYWSKISNCFLNLLAVLPINDADGRSGSTMSVSKAETMDRAITYPLRCGQLRPRVEL